MYFGPWALLVGFTSHFIALVTQTAPAAADLQCQQALGPSVLPFGDGFFPPDLNALQGPRGIQGPPGPAGKPGRRVSVLGAALTPELTTVSAQNCFCCQTVSERRGRCTRAGGQPAGGLSRTSPSIWADTNGDESQSRVAWGQLQIHAFVHFPLFCLFFLFPSVTLRL